MTTTTGTRARAWAPWAVVAVVAVVAGLVSVWRLLLTNSEVLSKVVWAEDGLFPLCVRAHNVASCLVDPFAGYLLFLPRVVAWPLSLVSMDAWPTATNIAAATLAAAAAALAALIAYRNGRSLAASAVLGLLPVIVPIVGVEAINATGSSYMLLVYVAALAVCLLPKGRFPTTAYAIGALVTALTIPSSAALLIALGVQMTRRRVPLRSGLVVGGVMVVGLAVQGVVALTAENPRPINFTWTSLRSWVDAMPSAMLPFWSDSASFGLVIVGLVAILGVALACLRSPLANAVGLLIVIGVLMGSIPAAAGYANNRYFVIPVLLWMAALLVAIDGLLPRWREAVMTLIGVVLIAACWQTLPASEFRASSGPWWPEMLAAARSACAANPDGTIAITFSPTWPFVDAVFPGPTNNVVACSVVAD